MMPIVFLNGIKLKITWCIASIVCDALRFLLRQRGSQSVAASIVTAPGK